MKPLLSSSFDAFLALHHQDEPLLLPNPFDMGSARILASLGYQALATTSSGAAATLGRLDGAIDRDGTLALAASIVAATELPVSADLENGFGPDPDDVDVTIRLACGVGLSGVSIEDSSGQREAPIFELERAVQRVEVAARAAHGGDHKVVLTARAENFLHAVPDLGDTISRLQRYQEAGADVLYAPGIVTLSDIRDIVRSVDRPVNVLARPGSPSVGELAELGVKRISVGGAFAFAAYGALVEAAQELRESGTYGFLDRARIGLGAARTSFPP